MKKILIINNKTKYLYAIKRIFENLNYEIKDFRKIKFEDIKDFSHILLTGGSTKIRNNEFLKEEIRILKKSKKPILGICFGYQLISYLFGANIKKLKVKREGFYNIKIIGKDPILKGLDNPLKVYENHNYVAKNIKNHLKVLAISKYGSEIIKHKSKRLYGFQFHPEINEENDFGIKLIQNFLNLK